MTEGTTQRKPAQEMTKAELARYIDHTILRPEATEDEIRQITRDGVDFGVASVCVNPASLDFAAPIVENTSTGLSVVCDFPFGQGTAEDKTQLAKEYCRHEGLTDLDMVINYGMVRSGHAAEAGEELRGAVDACRQAGVVSKVIIETDALSDEQIVEATEAVIASGADFVKTSTGFYTGGPTVGGSVEVMKKVMNAANGRIKVKASAHIRTREHFLALIDLGVDRIGLNCTSTPKVLSGAAE
ncbi:deoxyribose-phosphate aldolase [Bifidobacterium sp. ESL0769]|uniref:deoxyribose-phosphate aldolase n=1 Tax=Bifidobacterium sp. ESL0769 TaxID=2983229 RepID=UPI0023F92D60|nr:deoxyribose-phosphate aldolase [Bifidobacterium sp. ESL0769]WEV68152.1 deoxyribose-phosphate aldolase [Bifidobacterium sp. ESL0769]